MRDDRRAMEKFLASIERRAFLMARIATGDVDESMDIVQDAMLALVKKYHNKPEDSWKPLFYRILQNRIRDWYRRTKVRNRWRIWLGGEQPEENGVESDLINNVADPHGEDPDSAVMRSETADALTAALAQLPLKQQQTFMLRAWEGLSVRETATAMQCSQGTIKTHYARALASLRNRLEDHWP